MQARMDNLATVAAGGYKAMFALEAFLNADAVPRTTLDLVRLRVSQINGCAFCTDMHAVDLRKAGETDERLFSVATWHDAPYFTDEERAALALAEAATRISDRTDPVPDDVWDAAADYFDEAQLGALVMCIAAINAWNRINVTTRQLPRSHSVAARV